MIKYYEIDKIYGLLSSCAIESAVERINGVNTACFNTTTNILCVDFDDTIASDSDIHECITNQGFAITTLDNIDNIDLNNNLLNIKKSIKKVLNLSLIPYILLLIISLSSLFKLPFIQDTNAFSIVISVIQLVLSVAIIFICRSYYYDGLYSLIKGSPNENTLVSIASIIALVFSIFSITTTNLSDNKDLYLIIFSTSIIASVFLNYYQISKVSSLFNKIQLDKTYNNKYNVIRNYHQIEIATSDITLNDTICIKPAEIFPFDGVVTKGYSFVDECPLTNVTTPLEKTMNSKIYAGSINKSGKIEYKPTSLIDSFAKQKRELIKQSLISKTEKTNHIENISSKLIIAIIAIALISFGLWFIITDNIVVAINIGLSVLLVASPSIWAFSSYFSPIIGASKLSSKGVILKTLDNLVDASKTNTIVLDKNEAITDYIPVIQDVLVSSLLNDSEFYYIVYSLEKKSTTPISLSIKRFLKSKELKQLNFDNFKQISSKGYEAIASSNDYFRGTIENVRGRGIDVSHFEKAIDDFSKQGKETLIFVHKKNVIGLMTYNYRIKESSKNAINNLTDLNIETIMMSSSAKSITDHIASDLALTAHFNNINPGHKIDTIKDLQDHDKFVAMVGYNQNNTGAYDQANLAIAIGAKEKIDIHDADIILTHSDLTDVYSIIKIGKEVSKKLDNCLFKELLYNAILVSLCAGIIYVITNISLSPLFALGVMFISSFLTITIESSYNPILDKEIKEVEERSYTKSIVIDNMKPNDKENIINAFNKYDGITVSSDGDDTITVEASFDISDEIIKQIINDLGYKVTAIK